MIPKHSFYTFAKNFQEASKIELDFIDDMIRDESFPKKTKNKEEIVSYLNFNNACSGAEEAFESLWGAYIGGPTILKTFLERNYKTPRTIKESFNYFMDHVQGFSGLGMTAKEIIKSVHSDKDMTHEEKELLWILCGFKGGDFKIKEVLYCGFPLVVIPPEGVLCGSCTKLHSIAVLKEAEQTTTTTNGG